MPDFEIDSSKWTSMAYLFEDPPPVGKPIGIGLIFNDASLAAKVFNLFRAWNFDELEDTENNICVSLIIDEADYYVLIFPNMERETVRRSWRNLRRRARRAGPNREPFLIVTQLVLCKTFSTMHGYHVGYFKDGYKVGEPYQLCALLEDPSGTPRPIPEVSSIVKHHVRIAARSELRSDDFEYVYLSRAGL